MLVKHILKPSGETKVELLFTVMTLQMMFFQEKQTPLEV